jgi:hypothetical protein
MDFVFSIIGVLMISLIITLVRLWFLGEGKLGVSNYIQRFIGTFKVIIIVLFLSIILDKCGCVYENDDGSIPHLPRI